MTCRIATESDLDCVASVHVAAFPNFFLTLLGRDFLKAMYYVFLMTPGNIFIVQEDSDQIVGFAVGLMKSAKTDRALAVKFLPRFVFPIIGAMIRNPVVVFRRFIGKMLDRSDAYDTPEGTVMLRSIGVMPNFQGTGVARKLIETFEKFAKTRGACFIALTTDADDNERAIGFYSRQGFKIEKKFKQNESREMLLLIKQLTS